MYIHKDELRIAWKRHRNVIFSKWELSIFLIHTTARQAKPTQKPNETSNPHS